MLSALLLFASAQGPSEITRDTYGVPHISASTVDQAFFAAGYATAQDRMWQMESSRRLARGKMAEVFGTQYVASDKEVLQTGYTDAELQGQFDKLSPFSRQIIDKYADGVNAFIANGKLPEGFAKAGYQPEKWTRLDSVAIAVRLLQTFGKGGAGELRNMALFGYLQGRPNLKGKELDVFDDFAWQNDPESPTTISNADDPLAAAHPAFYAPDRAATVKHLAQLPKLSLLDLLPAIRMASREESTRVAEISNVVFKTGSYCVVVGKQRSADGTPILLNGPQMGFRTPSIVHEMSIEAPGLSVVGMDLPGVPGVLIGHTKAFAWGLTSGVADTDDIFSYKASGPNGYMYGDQTKTIQEIHQTLKVKGGADTDVVQKRTEDGPLVLEAKPQGYIFAKKTSYWGREMESYDSVTSLWTAKGTPGIISCLDKATMSFNYFFATCEGDIGYRYCGLVPMRAEGLDPRFPTPGSPQNAWKGFVPLAQMPHVTNPKSGVIYNWNNKPVSWWPNFDTPTWGRIFRNEAIAPLLTKPKLNTQDVEMVPWTIARTDETWPFFKPFLPAGGALESFDGRLTDGSRTAGIYKQFVDALRSEIFLGTTGNFIAPSYFQLVGQPSVMLRALQGKTKINYLAGRKASDVVSAALAKVNSGGRYGAPSIAVPGEPPIPYFNRGTYIQVVELLPDGPSGRNVLPPGIAETGEHSLDQVPLSRAWVYKPMHFGGK